VPRPRSRKRAGWKRFATGTGRRHADPSGPAFHEVHNPCPRESLDPHQIPAGREAVGSLVQRGMTANPVMLLRLPGPRGWRAPDRPACRACAAA
jgi:hypothetical protein